MKIEPYSVPCDACGGHGYQGRLLCLKCEGNGSVLLEEKVSLWRWLKERVSWMRWFSWN